MAQGWRESDRARRVLSACLTAAVLAVSTTVVAEQAPQCPTPPVEPCVTRHGRLSSQNGIPFAIWLIGTTRRVGVANGLDGVPAEARRYLEMTSPDHSYIYGDFEICPLEPDVPGHMRHVCLVTGKNLVIENLQALWPTFRLRSTWTEALRSETRR